MKKRITSGDNKGEPFVDADMRGVFDDSLRLQATKMDTGLTNLDHGEFGVRKQNHRYATLASVIAHCNVVPDPESLG